jgi:pyruvate dehydrogenase E1 component alpha subunit
MTSIQDSVDTSTDTEDVTAPLAQMLAIRAFEERLQGLFSDGLVRGSTHLAIGQEAVAVGSALALHKQDLVYCTYRGHHHCLARGMSPTAAFAEILGRVDGCCGGLGGSMHLTDRSLGLMGCYAIVGAHIPIAVGSAWASKIADDGVVTVCFFGDGTTTIGAFHEALNLAAVWSLPVVFVCENNLYSEYTPTARVSPVGDPAAGRASAYAMAAEIVDGNDVWAVRDAIRRARARAAGGEGPTVVEAKTYRQSGHSRADPGTYRPPGEFEYWLERDPIENERKRLRLSDDDLDSLRQRVTESIEADLQQALQSPEPDIALLGRHVFAEETR